MQYVLYLVAVGPWKLVRGLAFVINRWQRICRPLSQAVYYTSDLMDRHTPTVGTSHSDFYALIRASALMSASLGNDA